MSTDRYRQNALECLRLADQMHEPIAKTALVNLAQYWVNLADQAEKNSRLDLVYETPPAGSTAET